MPRRLNPDLAAYRLEAVARFRLQGYTVRQIAQILPTLNPPIVAPSGKPYGKSTIMTDLLRVRADALANAAIDTAEMVAMENETIMETRRQAFRLANKKDRLEIVLKTVDRKANLFGLIQHQSTITVEGGKTPLKVQNQTLVPIAELDLPLDVKRQVLVAMHAYTAEHDPKEGLN